MYAYFALGEVPYLRVLRQSGAYSIVPISRLDWGQPTETPSPECPSHIQFTDDDALSGQMARFLANLVKESGAYIILPAAVPKLILRTFTKPFADIADEGGLPLWDHVLTGNIEEPRALMRNFIAVNGLPHWWKEGGEKCSVSSIQYPVFSGGKESGAGTALRPLTKKIGTGRMAVAVFGDDESGYSLDLGLWSPAQGRVLNSSEEASSQKCRFTTSNPTATHFQKRIFAEIAAETAIFKHYDFKTWGLSPIDEVVQFVERYDAVVVVAETIPRYVVERILSAFGPQRVFSPPYIGLSRSASGDGRFK